MRHFNHSTRLFFLLTLLLAQAVGSNAQELVINEVMYLNNGVVADQHGAYPAWIELYNNGSSDLQLNDYYLSNSPFRPKLWRLPLQELEPGAFVMVFASAMNITDAPPYHANFSIENLENRVFLFGQDGTPRDATPNMCVPENRSLGRLPDGFADWTFPSHATAGSTNNTAYADEPDHPDIALEPSHSSGYYDGAINLALAGNGDYEIRYTHNTGAMPKANSALFTAPLPLDSRASDPNVYAEIPTTQFIADYPTPEQGVNKSHVVRAAAFADGCPVSEVYTGNFIVAPEAGGYRYPADVVFVNTAPANLFDQEKGIYVYGQDGNYIKRGDLWERPANIEWLDANGNPYFKEDGGIRVHGGGTRQGPQKSIRLYARKEYGASTFEYPFFADRDLGSYKRLILRMTMGDWTGTLFKDHLCHAIVKDINVGYMSGKVSVVFLNGEYWGVFNLRERQDQHYLESHYGVDDDNVDMIEYSLFDGRPIAEEGDFEAYDDLIHFLEQNDLREQSNYAQVAEMIDISNFIDQHIAQLYFANIDFPGNNNTLWQSRAEDGIWRWLFYDCDACMARPGYNHLHENVEGGQSLNSQPDWSMIIFRALLQNESFKDQFVGRFRQLLNTTFSAGRVIDVINAFQAAYTPLVAEHIARWQFPNHFTEWLSNVEGLRQFAMQRPVEMNSKLEQYFGNPMEVVPNPNNGVFSLNFIGDAHIGTVALYSSRGERVAFTDYAGALKSTIDFSRDLPTGIYLLKAEVEGRYYTEKVVVVD